MTRGSEKKRVGEKLEELLDYRYFVEMVGAGYKMAGI
jgi:hypothetical protein